MMFRLVLVLSAAIVYWSCSSKIHVLKKHFEEVPIPPPPDYANIDAWAAHPLKRDAADSVPLKSSLRNEQATARADVFFVYPTIFTDKPKNEFQWNADVYDAELNQKIQSSTILNQSTIFNGACRVFSPYYRQAHLYAFYTDNKKGASNALDLAYGDVKKALEFYLENHNQGRPIVIASHSQGSYHTMRLLKDFFDGKPLQKQLVMAYLVGRAIAADAFETINPCSTPEETGVWASWNTFARNYIPPTYDKYYTRALSTNPLLWNSSEEFASVGRNVGGVALKFTMMPQLADAQNHQNLLWTNKPNIRGGKLVRTKVWHRADMNFYYNNIRENVKLRVEKFLNR